MSSSSARPSTTPPRGSPATRSATGVTQIAVLHGQNQAGEIGAAAIERAVTAAGGTVAANISYAYSQDAIVKAMPDIVAQIQAANAQAVFLTADNSGALPLVTQLLKDNGIDTSPNSNAAGAGTATQPVRLIGLARWDIPASALALSRRPGRLVRPARSRRSTTSSPPATRRPTANRRCPIASLGYDGIAAIGALARAGNDFSVRSLTQPAGFAGVDRGVPAER